MNRRLEDWEESWSDAQCSISSVTGFVNFWGLNSQYTQLTSCKSSGILNCPVKPTLMSTLHSVCPAGTAPSGICSLSPYFSNVKLREWLAWTTQLVSEKNSKPRRYPTQEKKYAYGIQFIFLLNMSEQYILLKLVLYACKHVTVSRWIGKFQGTIHSLFLFLTP